MNLEDGSSFPMKLMSILNKDAYQGIIEWLPHGNGFIILDKSRFSKEVLPLHFGKSKYTSFTRRLNRWKFMFRTLGNKKSLYFHPYFTKNNVKLCLNMRPKPQKKYSRGVVVQSSSSGSLINQQEIPSLTSATEPLRNGLNENDIMSKDTNVRYPQLARGPGRSAANSGYAHAPLPPLESGVNSLGGRIITPPQHYQSPARIATTAVPPRQAEPYYATTTVNGYPPYPQQSTTIVGSNIVQQPTTFITQNNSVLMPAHQMNVNMPTTTFLTQAPQPANNYMSYNPAVGNVHYMNIPSHSQISNIGHVPGLKSFVRMNATDLPTTNANVSAPMTMYPTKGGALDQRLQCAPPEASYR